MSDGTCNSCKHRLSKLICGSQKSPHFNQKIERTSSCSYFTENLARKHLDLASFLGIEKGDYSAAIPEAQAALDLGLPADDEVAARHILGENILFLEIEQMKRKENAEITPMSQRLSEGIYQLETALKLDARGGYGFYLHSPNRGACCWRLEPLYELRAEWIRNQKGVDAAAEYLEKKLRLFEYLPGVYMAALHLQLALLYEEKNQKRQAADHYQKVIEAKDLSEDLGEDFIEASYKNYLARKKALAWMQLEGVGSKSTPGKSLDVALGQLCESDPDNALMVLEGSALIFPEVAANSGLNFYKFLAYFCKGTQPLRDAQGQLDISKASRGELLAHLTNGHLDCLELALAQVRELEKNNPQKAQEWFADREFVGPKIATAAVIVEKCRPSRVQEIVGKTTLRYFGADRISVSKHWEHLDFKPYVDIFFTCEKIVKAALIASAGNDRGRSYIFVALYEDLQVFNDEGEQNPIADFVYLFDDGTSHTGATLPDTREVVERQPFKGHEGTQEVSSLKLAERFLGLKPLGIGLSSLFAGILFLIWVNTLANRRDHAPMASPQQIAALPRGGYQLPSPADTNTSVVRARGETKTTLPSSPPLSSPSPPATDTPPPATLVPLIALPRR